MTTTGKKQELFDQATASYQKAADYGFLELITESSYQLASLHESFAKSFRQSKRPPDLNAQDQQLYEKIIAQQADPLEQLAIQIHQTNIDRAWNGDFTPWIGQSFTAMRRLQPARYDKTEAWVTYGEGIR